MRSILLLSALLLASCSCPDLAVQALVFTFEGVDGSLLTLNVTDAESGEAVLTGASPDDAGTLEAGRYDITFDWDGVQANSLEDLCTEGYMTGCEAEDFEQEGGIVPNIVVEAFQDSIVATLESNGNCP